MEALGDDYRSPFDELLEDRILEASGSRVVVELPVRPVLHQPNGIVHGGVYAALVETAASIGATLWLAGAGVAVGTSNHTDFLRSVRAGTLRAVGTPIQQGRTLQLWEVAVRDAEGTAVAHGKVKLMNVGRRSR